MDALSAKLTALERLAAIRSAPVVAAPAAKLVEGGDGDEAAPEDEDELPSKGASRAGTAAEAAVSAEAAAAEAAFSELRKWADLSGDIGASFFLSGRTYAVSG